jgi:hypothetical protein
MTCYLVFNIKLGNVTHDNIGCFIIKQIEDLKILVKHIYLTPYQ